MLMATPFLFPSKTKHAEAFFLFSWKWLISACWWEEPINSLFCMQLLLSILGWHYLHPQVFWPSFYFLSFERGQVSEWLCGCEALVWAQYTTTSKNIYFLITKCLKKSVDKYRDPYVLCSKFTSPVQQKSRYKVCDKILFATNYFTAGYKLQIFWINSSNTEIQSLWCW